MGTCPSPPDTLDVTHVLPKRLTRVSLLPDRLVLTHLLTGAPEVTVDMVVVSPTAMAMAVLVVVV